MYIPYHTQVVYTQVYIPYHNTLGTPLLLTPPSSSLLAGCTLRVVEALGSNREKGLGMRRREAPFVLRCDGW